jgi:WD40 repeat protein
MSTGVLSTEGLNRYDKNCVYANLKYFKISYKPRLWDYSQVSTIENLNLGAYSLLRDGRLCGSTSDYDLCIYNIDTNAVTTMKGHTEYVCASFQLEDGRICSCSGDKTGDKTIKLWNIEFGQCDMSIDGHDDLTHVIQLIDGRLCSGSHYSTIMIWSKDNGACELIINSGIHIYSLVQLRDGRICTGHYGYIRVWSKDSGVCEMTFEGHICCVTVIVVIDELRICSCSDYTKIKILNVSTGVCERTLEGHTDCVMDMVLLLDRKLCSVSYDGNMRIWSIETGVCEISTQVSSSSKILRKVVQLHDGRLVVSDSDKSVYIIGE